MQNHITPDEIQAAAKLLAKHARGRAALQRLAAAVESGDLDLGLLDQRAFLTLLGGAWKGERAAVTAAARDALAPPP